MSHADAVIVLRDLSSGKSPRTRLHAWLVCLGLASEHHDLPSILTEQLRRYESEPDCDSQRQAKDIRTIDLDLVRSEFAFREMAAAVHLHLLPEDAPIKTVRRILCSLLRHLNYYQGYDRFAWIFYLVSRQCTNALELSSDCAEAAAWCLTGRVLSSINFAKALTGADPPEDAFYKDMDAFMHAHLPRIWGPLAAHRQQSFFFALGWRMLWFADAYPREGVDDLLLIWDQLIVRLQERPNYIRDLAFAHLMQIPDAPENGVLMLERIQRYREWKVRQIVRVAGTFAGPSGPNVARSSVSTRPRSMMSQFVLCVFVIFLMMFVR